jgi:glucose uptake protein GlcU
LTTIVDKHTKPRLSLHGLGVICGLTAAVWLGAAEAPTKLVTAGFSPFAISSAMVCGVFLSRWTFPTLLKGTAYVFADLADKKHLIIWALLAGVLWAEGNTLTVFAIRDVGLTVAFPLWNANSLIGLLWGRVLFCELKGANRSNIAKVVLGALAIALAAIMLGFSTVHAGVGQHAMRGVIVAIGAAFCFGTMYVPYRKAYLSGMNPLSFVTAFTVGELTTVLALTLALDHGMHSSAIQLFHQPGLLFWLFLGGCMWVVGDLFQQFAAKYVGIGRGIPLSNTNQLWGLAWGALVFGELAGASHERMLMVIGGSAVMILGALAISTAVASEQEQHATDEVVMRECERYELDHQKVVLSQQGDELDRGAGARRWWDYVIVFVSTAIFIWLGVRAVVTPLQMNLHWLAVLTGILLLALAAGAYYLGKRTHFE